VTTTSETQQVGGWRWRRIITADPNELQRLGEELRLDPYVIEDLLDVEQLPKAEEIGDTVFVVLHALRGAGDVLDTVDTYHVITEDELLTVCSEDVPVVAHVWDQLSRGPLLASTPMEAIARIADLSAQRFLAAAAAIERRALGLQESAVVGNASVLPIVLTLRNEETAVRRVLGPQAVAVTVLAGGGLAEPTAARRLRDAAASTERAAAEFTYARSLLADVLEVYRGAVAEKTNEVTRVLTVYAAIMFPLGIIVGFWGMNFGDLPLLDGSKAWWFVVAGMAGFSVVSWNEFRRRGWIGGPSLRDLPMQLGRGVVGVATAPIRFGRSSSGEDG
jgi:magnesium transporter